MVGGQELISLMSIEERVGSGMTFVATVAQSHPKRGVDKDHP
jgi:hypothetical protein